MFARRLEPRETANKAKTEAAKTMHDILQNIPGPKGWPTVPDSQLGRRARHTDNARKAIVWRFVRVGIPGQNQRQKEKGKAELQIINLSTIVFDKVSKPTGLGDNPEGPQSNWPGQPNDMV